MLKNHLIRKLAEKISEKIKYKSESELRMYEDPIYPVYTGPS